MSRARWLDVVPVVGAALLAGAVLVGFARRITYPFDLEWMEGGMLAHAWRITHGLPLYPDAGPEWIPFVYPPGYSGLLAALSPLTGLDYTVGRAVSIAGTLLAAATLAVAIGRRGEPAVGFVMAACFLGCWRASGAFYDLVRPDGLAIGLLAVSIALAVERARWTAPAAGVVLFAAFLVKHHCAAFGVPLALGLLVRDGRRRALVFGLCAAVPAGLFTLIEQVATDGRFLRYLLAVPASHPMDWRRVSPGTPGELGAWLVPAIIAVGLGLNTVRSPVGEVDSDAKRTMVASVVSAVWTAVCVLAGQRFLWPFVPWSVKWPLVPWPVIGPWLTPVACAAGLAVAVIPLRHRSEHAGALVRAIPGVFVGGLVTLLALDPDVRGVAMPPLPVLLVTGAAIGVALGAGLQALVWRGLGDRTRGGNGAFWLVWGLGAVALGVGTWMRGHYGGFMNVFVPTHFAILAGCGWALTELRRRDRSPRAHLLTAGWMVLQVGWIGAQLDVAEVVPTDEDRAAGEVVLEGVRGCPDGPILSPYAAWLPVQVGRAPSPHLIAIWDIDHPEGPFLAGMGRLTAAARSHRWACVVKGGRQPIGFGVEANYKPSTTFRVPAKAMMPKTGWRVKPSDLLVPKEPR